MLETISRKEVWKRNVNVAPEEKHKVLASDEVCVVNPVTKQEETHIVNSYKEEPVIDPRLRASDFALEVQIRSGVQLKDCGKYYTPSTPEEYVAMIQNLVNSVESKFRSQESPKEASKESPKEAPKEKPIIEPSNS